MSLQEFQRTIEVGTPLEHLWDWHQRPGAFERIAPPWQQVELLTPEPGVSVGENVLIRLRKAGLSRLWKARIVKVEEGCCFVDVQESGPFAHFRHQHLMSELTPATSQLRDRITFKLPGWCRWVPGLNGAVKGQLGRVFRFRQERMRADLERYAGGQPGVGRRVLITGSTGLVGRRLKPFLQTLGFEVCGLSRSAAGEGTFSCDPAAGWIDPRALEGVDAVIHLAGENIASGRWSEGRKRRIMESRIQSTDTLVSAMAAMEVRPEVLISASGANFYGSSPELKDERSPAGDGFLAEVCSAWENAAFKARDAGIRTVCLRTGVVLDPGGGALARMLPAFLAGMGGRIGSGKQAFSWIGMDQLLDCMVHVLDSPGLEGPLNAVHPDLVSQAEFARLLARLLRRPAVMPMPAGLVSGLFGEMGRETLLADLPVRPAVLEGSGFTFRQADLAATLGSLLGHQLPHFDRGVE
jgi:uncharacterized protein (TIGR01777 family)